MIFLTIIINGGGLPFVVRALRARPILLRAGFAYALHAMVRCLHFVWYPNEVGRRCSLIERLKRRRLCACCLCCLRALCVPGVSLSVSHLFHSVDIAFDFGIAFVLHAVGVHLPLLPTLAVPLTQFCRFVPAVPFITKTVTVYDVPTFIYF